MQQDLGDGQVLFLAAGQAVPPLAHDRVVAVRELGDPMVGVRRPGVNRYTGTVQCGLHQRSMLIPVGRCSDGVGQGASEHGSGA